MGDGLRIAARLAGASIRSEWQYRTSFVLRVIGNALATLLDFLELGVLFLYLREMAGWSITEVAFLYGISSVGFGICDMLIGHLDTLPSLIRSGGFDAILIRPLGSLTQILLREVSLRRIGKVAQAAAVLVWAITQLGIDWNLAKVGLTALTILTAVAIFAGLWIIGITISFWWVETAELVNTVTYGGNYLTEHPLGIFPRAVRGLVMLIPVAFVSYFPSLAILEKSDPLAYPSWAAFLGLPVAAVTCLAASWQWRNAVRHYRSTGS